LRFVRSFMSNLRAIRRPSDVCTAVPVSLAIAPASPTITTRRSAVQAGCGCICSHLDSMCGARPTGDQATKTNRQMKAPGKCCLPGACWEALVVRTVTYAVPLFVFRQRPCQSTDTRSILTLTFPYSIVLSCSPGFGITNAFMRQRMRQRVGY
jgi:hypothetical protein